MIHARPDYNRIQDPAAAPNTSAEDRYRWGMRPGSTPFAAEEPVMLFRAQDKHFLAVLAHYHQVVSADNADPEIIAALEAHSELARNWQASHPPKTPDL